MFSKFVIYNFNEVYEQVLSRADFYQEGKKLLDSYKEKINESLNNYYLKDNQFVDALDIERRWFPEIECDIFISHSHKDKEQLISFVGWLHYQFGIKAFIDDGIWDNVDDLAQNLATKVYQDRFEDTWIDKDEANNYGMSNALLILNGAIENMIDSTECFLFIGTNNSLIDGDTHTKSPWIYTENLFSNFVRRRPLSEYRKGFLAHSKDISESLKVSYKCDFGSYIEITRDDLTNLLLNRSEAKISEENLNMLYEIKGFKEIK